VSRGGGEYEPDLSRENVDHIRSRFHETMNLIYNVTSSSESNSDNGHEVFMVGLLLLRSQEIAKAAIAEIIRSKKLAMDMEKAAGMKHMSP
jgi:hypothetical protein